MRGRSISSSSRDNDDIELAAVARYGYVVQRDVVVRSVLPAAPNAAARACYRDPRRRPRLTSIFLPGRFRGDASCDAEAGYRHLLAPLLAFAPICDDGFLRKETVTRGLQSDRGACTTVNALSFIRAAAATIDRAFLRFINRAADAVEIGGSG